MAEFSRFYGSAEGDTREYNQIQFAEVLNSITGNGILNLENALQVTQSTPAGMSIVVNTGQAWINGYWYHNDEQKALTISPSDVTLNRFDRIILRLDTLTNRIIELDVLEGVPASSPNTVALTQNSEIYEIELARVYIGFGVTSITNAWIFDFRTFIDKASYRIFTATIPYTSWTGASAPYSKEVTVTGLLSTDKPIIDIVLTGTYATDVTMRNNWALIYRGVSDDDFITFYADSVPSADISIQLLVVR